MQKSKRIWMAAAGLALAAALFYGGLWLYGSRDLIPPGTAVGSLRLGGLPAEKALHLLEARIADLEERQVEFVDTEIVLSWRKAGITWSAPGFRAGLSSLSEGGIWQRARARFHFKKEWALQTSFHAPALKRTFSPTWEKRQFGSPVNAVRTIHPDDSISYSPGTSVRRIDWPLLQRRMLEAAKEAEGSGAGRLGTPGDLAEGVFASVQLPLTEVPPAVTVESLKRQGIRRKIAEFSTGLGASVAGRVHNVDAAARALDGLVLPPDGVFDYAAIVRAAEEQYGFREAPVIFGGRLVPGVGGGICQVSSTLYNAAVRAGLDIVERRNHSVPVRYIPLGQDATFAEGHINFRFRNTTGNHLLIAARTDSGRLTVKLFGDIPGNVLYDMESKTAKILPAGNKYVVNPALPAGSRKVIVRGKPGFVVDTYRVKYVDGRIAERIRLSRDTYPAQPNVIAVPPGAGGGTGAAPDDAGGAGDARAERDAQRGGNAREGGRTPGSGKPPAAEGRPPALLEDGVGAPQFP
ncbi:MULTISPECIES: VanW family protein [Paenibacillus]|uniref:VanW family protein n=1 Tax=Paenibacillus TaxID=44249 RepID=UPI002FE21CBF